MKVNTDTDLQKRFADHTDMTRGIKEIILYAIDVGTIDVGDIPNRALYRPAFGSLATPVYSPWNSMEFKELFWEQLQLSLLPARTLYNLLQTASQCTSFKGAFVELGTYKGGTASALEQEFNLGNRLWCFDTFEGLKDSGNNDVMIDGEFSDVNLDDVKELLPNACIVKGLLPETLSGLGNAKIAFCHIDIDLYKPILSSLMIIYDLMVPGGIILFDDYGGWSTPGARLAVDEFFASKLEKPIINMTGQAMVIKR